MHATVQLLKYSKELWVKYDTVVLVKVCSGRTVVDCGVPHSSGFHARQWLSLSLHLSRSLHLSGPISLCSMKSLYLTSVGKMCEKDEEKTESLSFVLGSSARAILRPPPEPIYIPCTFHRLRFAGIELLALPVLRFVRFNAKKNHAESLIPIYRGNKSWLFCYR